MASSSRSKRRSKIEPITVDELLNAAGMSGFVSFLKVKPEEYGRATAPEVDTEPASTVAAEAQTTVDAITASTVVAENAPGMTATSTVDIEPTATVDVGPITTIADEITTTVVDVSTSTVDAEPQTTNSIDVANNTTSATTVAAEPPSTTTYWTIEGIGGLFPASRLRRIKLAQDVLTHAEESVYDVLWGVKDQSRDRERKTAMGYETIAKAARVSKRNAAEIVQRLIQKGFIELDAPPVTFGARRPAVYRVFGYTAVRDDQRRRNRVWTIRTGNGIGYAKPVALHVDTADAGPSSTVDADQPSTMDAGDASTVSLGQPPTVDAGATVFYIDKNKRQTTATATSVADAISEAMGRADDEAAARITAACKGVSPDATDEEIAHFIRQEGPAIRRNRSLDNPMGVLIRHIPRCCSAENLRLYREAARLEQERSRRQIQSWLDSAHQVLSTSGADPMERSWAEEIVATYEGGEGKS